MFWTYLLTLVIIFITIYILFFSKKPILGSPFVGSSSQSAKEVADNLDPRISKRLLNFADFMRYLTHEKTATHVGSSEMKTLRGMLSQQSLGDLSPAVLRGWSRAIRDRVGEFDRIKLDSIQFQEDGKLGKDLCQMLAEVEFKPLEKKDDLDFRKKKTSADENNKQKENSVCAVVLRFRKSVANTTQDDDKTPIRENVAGFHVLPPNTNNNANNKPEPFDIMSYIDPFEIDQFAESAIEALFDKKFSTDPMDGFFKFCTKPLQNLYDLKNQEEKEKQQKEKPNPNDLPPKQRREKLKNDMTRLKLDMGLLSLNSSDSKSSYSPTVTMNDAELDEKSYATSNTKCIQARVTHTGPERDCIVTIHVILDGESSYGLAVIRYNFLLGASKKKTVLFDQDTKTSLGTI